MTEERHIQIPERVFLDKRLNANSKLLYGEISSLCYKEGYCWASNAYFAERHGVSKVSISKWVNQLIETGYIKSEIQYKKDSKEVEKRILTVAHPIKQNFNTPLTKVNDPIKENFNTPIKEKLKDNNTSSFNNTINNTSDNNLRHASSIYIYYRDSVNASLTKLQEQQIDHWLEHVTVDMLKHGINRVVEHSPEKPFNYLKSIIERWMRDGVQNLAQVQNDDERYERIKARNKNRNKPSDQQQQMQFDGGLPELDF